MSQLPLTQITLCAVDCETPALSLLSLLQSMRRARFARVVLFTHDWLPAVVVPGVEVIDVDLIRTPAERSRFVLRHLGAHVRSSHALLTRWDAGVLNTEAWTDEFLVYDYLGAPWSDRPAVMGAGQGVGQGGFSLRSRRLLRAGADLRLVDEHPDDEVLCGRWRPWLEEVHGVHIAPAALARRWAASDEPAAQSQFGFLGAQHLPRLLPEHDLHELVTRLPLGFLQGAEATRLLQALLERGLPAVAEALRLQCERAARRPAVVF